MKVNSLIKRLKQLIIITLSLLPIIVAAESNGFYDSFIETEVNNNKLQQIDDNIYIYKGGSSNNLNNFIKFNNELWRIIGFYNNQIKIIRADSLGKYPLDNNGNAKYHDNSSLKNMLNEGYINSFDSISRNMLDDNGKWNVGKVNYEDNASEAYNSAKQTIWEGAIGIIATYEWLYATNGENCYETKGNLYPSNCGKNENNWLTPTGTSEAWTLSPNFYDESETRGVPVNITTYGNTSISSSSYTKFRVFPSVYLKSNVIIISGSGTSNDPYITDIVYKIDIQNQEETKDIDINIENLAQVKNNKEVKFKIIPKKGYFLSGLSILDSNNNKIEYLTTDNINYSFMMPNNNITIIPEYLKVTNKINVEKNNNTKEIEFNIDNQESISYEENNKINYKKLNNNFEYEFSMPDKSITIKISYKKILFTLNNPNTTDKIYIIIVLMIAALAIISIIYKNKESRYKI